MEDTLNATDELVSSIADTITTETAQTQSLFASMLGDLSLTKIIAAALLFIVSMLAIKLIMKATNKMLEKSKLEKSFHTFISSVVKIVLLFIMIMLVAGTLGIDTSSLLAILSVAGLAVSLSIQDSLSNMASGVLILTAKPFKVGDFIEVKSRQGTVLEIGLIYTRIATLNNQIIHIPNNQITSNEIVNSSSQDKRRVDLTLSASYDCDVEQVKQALQQAAVVDNILPEPILARVSKYGDSAIEYALRVWTTPEHYWDVYYDVLENVKRVFDAEGIVMTYPHLNVHTIENS